MINNTTGCRGNLDEIGANGQLLLEAQLGNLDLAMVPVEVFLGSNNGPAYREAFLDGDWGIAAWLQIKTDIAVAVLEGGEGGDKLGIDEATPPRWAKSNQAGEAPQPPQADAWQVLREWQAIPLTFEASVANHGFLVKVQIVKVNGIGTAGNRR